MSRVPCERSSPAQALDRLVVCADFGVRLPRHGSRKLSEGRVTSNDDIGEQRSASRTLFPAPVFPNLCPSVSPFRGSELHGFELCACEREVEERRKGFY